MPANVQSRPLSIGRVKVWSSTAVAVLVILRVLGGHTFLRLPRVPDRYDASRHTLVANLAFQDEDQSSGEIDEWEAPAIWFAPVSGTFHTTLDRGQVEDVHLQNQLLLAASLLAGVIIVMVLVSRRVLLARLGVQFDAGVNPELPWFFRRQPLIRYAALCLAVMFGVVFGGDMLVRAWSKSPTGVAVSVVNPELYRRFYYGHPEQVRQWTINMFDSVPHVITDLPEPNVGD